MRKLLVILTLLVLVGLVSVPVSAQVSANLSWTDNSTNEDGFGVYRCTGTGCTTFTKLLDVGVNVTTYTDSNLAQATTFCYQVDAFNAAGRSAKSNTACGTTKAQLAVTKSGTGGGAVTSVPVGINCGATCSAWFDANASVSLSATPAVGSVFAGWGGACSGTGACVVAMAGARAVSAVFNVIPLPPAPSGMTVIMTVQ